MHGAKKFLRTGSAHIPPILARRLISFATHVRAWRRLKTRFETKIEIGVETLSFRPLLPFIATLEILSPAENLNFQPVTLSIYPRIHRFRWTA